MNALFKQIIGQFLKDFGKKSLSYHRLLSISAFHSTIFFNYKEKLRALFEKREVHLFPASLLLKLSY